MYWLALQNHLAVLFHAVHTDIQYHSEERGGHGISFGKWVMESHSELVMESHSKSGSWNLIRRVVMEPFF